MNYKQEYEEALERAKKEIKECGDNQGRINMIKRIFPELKESEDERIKKAIYNAIKYLETEHSWDFLDYNVGILDAYAWLEKQGEET